MPAQTYHVYNADSYPERILRVIHEEKQDRDLNFGSQMLALSHEGHAYEFTVITEVKFFLSRDMVNNNYVYQYSARSLVTIIMSSIAYNELLRQNTTRPGLGQIRSIQGTRALSHHRCCAHTGPIVNT